MRNSGARWLAAAGAWAAATGAGAQEAAPCFSLDRLEAFAIAQTLNSELLASRSATLTLENWCRLHHLAEPAQIRALQIAGADKPASRETRERLQAGEGELVKYRRVDLVCGDHVLSRADNWYVPARLTPEMNRALETSTLPFGKAVADLKPYRQTISAHLLWEPLPRGWEMHVAELPGCARPLKAADVPDALFEHRAVLTNALRQPFSEVVETYQRDVLAFAPGPIAP